MTDAPSYTPHPPIYVLLYEGPPEGHNPVVQADEKAACAIPGLAGLVYHSRAEDLIAGDFTSKDYARSLASPDMKHWHLIVGMPTAPVVGFDSAMLDLQVFGKPAPTLIPAVWQVGYQDWLTQAMHADLQDWQQQEDLHKLAYVGLAPSAITPDMAEMCLPSSTPGVHGTSYVPQIQAMGYTDAGYQGGVANLFGTAAKLYGVPLALQMHIPPCQQLGGRFDATCAYATDEVKAIRAAMQADVDLVPMNDVIRKGSTGGFAALTARAMCGGRLAVQLGTGPRKPGAIIAAYETALALNPDAIQVHPFDWSIIAEHIASTTGFNEPKTTPATAGAA